MSFLAWLPTLLMICLALLMFGLGLSLTVADFARLKSHPKAVLIALVLQIIVLPLVCYALIIAFGIAPIVAVGLMLLAASPGGVSANLFSHLFGGNVAMNISLTAINTVLSIATLPLIANWAIAAFAKTGQVVPIQFTKVIEVTALVLIPVVIGMITRSRAPRFAARMDKPMKIFSALLLFALAVLSIAKEWRLLTESFAQIGLAVITFNLISLLAGYYLSRASGLDKSISTAIGFEIGIHNSALAMFIALNVLNNVQLALPAGIYSVSMLVTATLFGFFVLRRRESPPLAAAIAAK
jgi:bile acid:Na+ symporter, BASS family